MKKIIAITIMFLFMLGLIVLDGGLTALGSVWNLPSLLVIVIIVLPMLIFSNNLLDFIRAFQIAMGAQEHTTKEMTCSHHAMGLAIKLVWLASFFGFLTGLINMLSSIHDFNMFKSGMSICLLTVYYASIINIFFYGVQAKVKKELTYRG